ncbi:Murein DD-endopeptidase MepM and murein hydrolase activator NlpD, contain LysM domain [Loktanella fryxellensis]|uniref:Murein DD-endopeptidase MepM and murein hydrolase activator NlpD, contain LysM domain n=1 Tax=Loktanella fryxellensis TaxID=245187 RepID=A0A1H7YW20_9RHOB|nr:peptidoglycan DD-metalloendopeptidase family protein [Loktanella fryxellensis]SEM50131.1 Murein DD-endopeptidase MepM and murein hydrolase activator NlpD, contain LysM domain [Loktanella fryxellensis]
MTATTSPSLRRFALTASALALLAACEGGMPDLDLRDQAGGFDTSPAVADLPDRPQPDARGVISYPGYQVVVAQRGDTMASIASRLNLSAAELASFNGVAIDTPLRQDEVVALPGRVAEPSASTGAVLPATGTIDVSAIATTALDRASSTAPVQGGLAPLPSAGGVEPIRHQVAPGESAFSISRLYNVPVETLSAWNGLTGDLAVREGQFLLIPQGGVANPAGGPTTAPGTGSGSPIPPSAAAPLPAVDPATPLPEAATPPAPSLEEAAPETETIAAPAAPAAPAAAPASDGRFLRPVAGSVIRDYAPGRNEGIDIGATAGATVQAADAGTVAAVTTDTNGTAIVVVRHADSLLTVYTNLEDLSVAKGDSVSRGGTLGKVKAGDPSFVHFEVRRGLESVDPNDFL